MIKRSRLKREGYTIIIIILQYFLLIGEDSPPDTKTHPIRKDFIHIYLCTYTCIVTDIRLEIKIYHDSRGNSYVDL